MTTIQQIVPEYKLLLPTEISVFGSNVYSVKVFDDIVISFFESLSKNILRDKQINQNPGIVALGFWLRRANIQSIIHENKHLSESTKYQLSPRGIVFHICPANVDTMFIYSLAISLLTGNKNILRVSAKIESPEINQVFSIISKTLETNDFNQLKNYLSIVRYPHNNDINTFFSLQADARIIWGGNQTVGLFKTFSTKSRNKDIVFPDRVSYSIFKAAFFIALDEKEQHETVRKFYNDSYVFDQKGCSSPQVLFVYGDNEDCKAFETSFYQILNAYSERNYQNDISSLASLKLNHLVADVFNEEIVVGNINRQSNYLYFVDIEKANQELASCGGGYFYVKNITSLDEIGMFITSDVQTLTYFGLDQDECNFILQISFGKGIDRIVPVGEALSFDYIWDGYNLIDELCIKKKSV